MEVVEVGSTASGVGQASAVLPEDIDAPSQAWLEHQKKLRAEVVEQHDRLLRFPDDMPGSDDPAAGAALALSLVPPGQPPVKSPPVPSPASVATQDPEVKAAPPEPPAPQVTFFFIK